MLEFKNSANGLLRKYKLSKISDIIVLSDIELELSSYLNKTFLNLKLIENVENSTVGYFDSNNILIIEKHIGSFFNTRINVDIFNSIKNHLKHYLNISSDYTQETYFLIDQWIEYAGYVDVDVYAQMAKEYCELYRYK